MTNNHYKTVVDKMASFSTLRAGKINLEGFKRKQFKMWMIKYLKNQEAFNFFNENPCPNNRSTRESITNQFIESLYS